jgi:aminoglycoside N3'-acetyltransferase
MKRTSNKQLEELFKSLGVSQGDKIILHADLRMFGLIENLGEDFLSILRDIVGPTGCLITPSFTFSFPGTFNLITSVSTTGAIGKLFARESGVKRVPDGMTSYYLLGDSAEKMIKEWRNTSYGIGSIPDQLTQSSGKVLQLGTDILSLVHYLEEMISVPYREIMRFDGKIEDGENSYESHTYFYARKLPVKKAIPDPIRSAYYDKCSNAIEFNCRTCRLFSCKDYIDFGVPRLKEDKWILIER